MNVTTGKAQNAEKVRASRLAIVAATMLLLTCGIFGGLFYLQRQAASDKTSHESRIAAEQAALEPTEAVSAKRVQHLKLLHEKWRPWALQHKKELKRMLNGDHAAMMAVYDAVPAKPKVEDAGFSSKELNSPVQGMNFTWQPSGKLYASAEEKSTVIAKRLQKHFATLHDIELSRSMNTGRSHITFWASGRITSSTYIDNPNARAGQPSMIEAPPEEIQPPYDFLQ